ncbi:MAG: ATPase, T2SS/T4P/T4SS family [Desulfobacterales bacterium]|nr:ATPase, T2SS/T4P/T4SS family [Desulfobacterales bacterium]
MMNLFRMTTRKKIGEILVHQGRITPEQLNEFLRIQKETSTPLGQILVSKEILSNEELANLLGEQLGIPHVWLRKGLVDPMVVHVLPKEKATQYQVVPMFRVHDTLTLATADPNAIFIFEQIAKITSLKIQPVLCRANDIMDAINESYRQDAAIDDIMASMEDDDIDLVETREEKATAELADMAGGSPVIHLTNMILLKSIRDGASDIHLEPQEDKFRIRARIDGVLYELMAPKFEMHAAVVSRLKVMANLDIAERRLPQDGRIQVKVDGRTVDLRFSSMPSIYGEKVVLRILDKSQAVLDLNQLGFEAEELETFKSLVRSPNGLILVCGPTGSGKTTTLYSAIHLLNTPDKNVVTIEDPVEYNLAGINQNQIMDSIGLTFARFIKHTLRQDPDIIMVGEIRDRETAEIAVQASLTGHLVLSTLHTNDSPSAITRLLEMGIEPYLISSALLACLSQRLVRSVCPECKTRYFAPKVEAVELGLAENKQVSLVRGKGCSACHDSGYKGRLALYELLQMDEGLQALILSNPSIDVLRGYLRKKEKSSTLKDAGHRKVLQGFTTLDEVRRVTTIDM